jgi:hypothetical protein
MLLHLTWCRRHRSIVLVIRCDMSLPWGFQFDSNLNRCGQYVIVETGTIVGGRVSAVVCDP